MKDAVLDKFGHQNFNPFMKLKNLLKKDDFIIYNEKALEIEEAMDPSDILWDN